MRYFTLGRKIDPRYKTNLWVLMMTVAVFGVRFLFVNDLGNAIVFAVGFFLSWALARELDPLHEYSAFVVGIVYLLMGIGFEQVDPGVAFFTILLLRVITRTTGQNPTAFDLAGILGLSLYLILTRSNGMYGVIFTLPMVIGSVRYTKNFVFKIFVVGGVIISIGGIITYQISLRITDLVEYPLLGTMFVLGLGAGLLYDRLLKEDQEILDDRGGLIENGYIRQAVKFYVVTYILLIIGTEGSIGTYSLFFAVLLGSLIYRLWMRIKK